MSAKLKILSAGPGLTVQDRGREGYLARGLSVGGAADRLALAEGAGLLGQSPDCAALEMAGMGGRFAVEGAPVRIALTGAKMSAKIDETPAAWNASHLLRPGQVLSIGAARGGNYGYLSLGGGIDLAPVMGARSAHLVCGIGAVLKEGEELPLAPDKGETGLTLPRPDRFGATRLRLIPSAQTDLFPQEALDHLTSGTFTRNPRSNRMGVRLAHDGPPFEAEGQTTILSEMVVPGDIQIAGDGTPFILLYEHQTTGGYPRIATVIPADLPVAAQIPPGVEIRFNFVTRDEALEAERRMRKHLDDLPRAPRPLVRDPGDVPDLLTYQLISGVTAGKEES